MDASHQGPGQSGAFPPQEAGEPTSPRASPPRSPNVGGIKGLFNNTLALITGLGAVLTAIATLATILSGAFSGGATVAAPTPTVVASAVAQTPPALAPAPLNTASSPSLTATVVSPTPAATESPTPSAAKPEVFELAADPPSVRPGDPVLITWRAQGDPQSVRLHGIEPSGKPSQTFLALGALSGRRRVVTNANLRERQRFLLHVESGGATAEVEAEVALLCPDAWLFPNAPQQKCPIRTLSTRVVAQRFERGLMLWTEADGSIYVLAEGKPWREGPDQWREGMPNSDPAILPPKGLRQPLRSLGLAWRTWPKVRDDLGWASGPEMTVADGLMQQAYEFGQVGMGGDRFVTGPDGKMLYLSQSSSRSYWGTWDGVLR